MKRAYGLLHILYCTQQDNNLQARIISRTWGTSFSDSWKYHCIVYMRGNLILLFNCVYSNNSKLTIRGKGLVFHFFLVAIICLNSESLYQWLIIFYRFLSTNYTPLALVDDVLDFLDAALFVGLISLIFFGKCFVPDQKLGIAHL